MRPPDTTVTSRYHEPRVREHPTRQAVPKSEAPCTRCASLPVPTFMSPTRAMSHGDVGPSSALEASSMLSTMAVAARSDSFRFLLRFRRPTMTASAAESSSSSGKRLVSALELTYSSCFRRRSSRFAWRCSCSSSILFCRRLLAASIAWRPLLRRLELSSAHFGTGRCHPAMPEGVSTARRPPGRSASKRACSLASSDISAHCRSAISSLTILKRRPFKSRQAPKSVVAFPIAPFPMVFRSAPNPPLPPRIAPLSFTRTTLGASGTRASGHMALPCSCAASLLASPMRSK
mmetsp:Transcript_16620/g.63215  ORF Transcript_16620/g.63215 Transcript_16620/m.63215 type:complete len:290 (+) Transcript_16620:554-1423(+)